ncbi:MAG TPA: orotidine 5'-phosphate decarboxylase, partial [Ktedonobacterales bacterium]|nr:orotidine 5'-phosphate decarboxylase [Ktedonobacterales bacterium]
FQDLRVRRDDAGKDAQEPLYVHVAQQVARRWNRHGNCALVVGATYPDELRQVRAVVDTLPILVPGVGAQGGDLEATLRAGMDSHGQGLVISVSRSVLYASHGPDFAEAARQEAVRLWREMNRIRGV